MTSLTETRQAYARNRHVLTFQDISADTLERRERELLDWLDTQPMRWQGTPQEVELACIQTELEIRTRSAKRQAA